MTASASSIEGAAVLLFAPHVRFRFDERRKAWIVLAPERLLLPDEPRQVIASDVLPMLQDLVDKKVLRQ